MTRILALLLLMAVPAVAHDNPTDWIGKERLKNADGQLCCGAGDCFPFEAAKIKTTPQGYVFSDGQVIPFNKAGPSVDRFFWRCIWSNETKCVFAPMGGS